MTTAHAISNVNTLQVKGNGRSGSKHGDKSSSNVRINLSRNLKSYDHIKTQYKDDAFKTTFKLMQNDVRRAPGPDNDTQI